MKKLKFAHFMVRTNIVGRSFSLITQVIFWDTLISTEILVGENFSQNQFYD